MEIYVKESEKPKACYKCKFNDRDYGTCLFDTSFGEYAKSNCPIKSIEKHDKEVREQAIKEFAISKDNEKQAVKDTAKFADLVEFHSIARMHDGVEYFTISSLGLKEILTEEFGFKYSEL